MEGLGDRYGCDLGTDLFREKDTLLDRLSGEVRSISGDQDVIEHYSFVLSLLLSDAPKVAGRAAVPAHKNR
jgi:hypothetical protein